MEANPGVNALWVGEGGQTLKALEERMRLHIYLKGNDSLKTQEYRLLAAGREESIRRQAIPVREGDELSLFIHETHAKSEETGISKLNGFIINVEDAGGNAGDIVNVKIEKVCRTYAKAVKL